MKEQTNDAVKMEFLLTLNDNIVVQRYFNVKGYNSKARRSLEVPMLLNEVTKLINQVLVTKTMVYMMDNMDQIMVEPEILETSNTDENEFFNVYVKIGEETICHRILDAKLYPPKVRYTVDIRPELKSILRALTDIFSSENLTHNYLNYSLI